MSPTQFGTLPRPISEWSEAELRSLLDWYGSAGVDVALSETPINRFAEKPPLVPAGNKAIPVPAAHPANPIKATPLSETTRVAVATAANASTMEELKEALSRFDGCNLKRTATNIVFADGNPEANVMLVGEAPGRDEDIQGVPFVGRSGHLLDRMLAAIGLTRETVYIANVVPWRPPGNRTPTPQETAACKPFIQRQIELCDPDILVCLGNASARELLKTSEGILRTRGKWLEYTNGEKAIRAMAMLHPAYLLRQPLHKRLAWRDLQALGQALNEPP